MNADRAGRRPPGVVLVWAAVLTVTVGLAIVGQISDGTPVAASLARPGRSAAVSTPVPPALPARPPSRPMATRPPIGEDGVMGGRVFGTAWGWLQPVAPER